MFSYFKKLSLVSIFPKVIAAYLVLVSGLFFINNLFQVQAVAQDLVASNPEAMLSMNFAENTSLDTLVSRINQINYLGITSLSGYQKINNNKIPFTLIFEEPVKNTNDLKSKYFEKTNVYFNSLSEYKSDNKTNNLDKGSLNTLTKNFSKTDLFALKIKNYLSIGFVYNINFSGAKANLAKIKEKLNSIQTQSTLTDLNLIVDKFTNLQQDLDNNKTVLNSADISKKIDDTLGGEISSAKVISSGNSNKVDLDQVKASVNLANTSNIKSVSVLNSLFSSVNVEAGGWDASLRLDGSGIRLWASNDLILNAIAWGNWGARTWIYKTALSICYAFWWVVGQCIATVGFLTTVAMFWSTYTLINTASNCNLGGVAMRLGFDRGGFRFECERK